jgi:hypothetical protein
MGTRTGVIAALTWLLAAAPALSETHDPPAHLYTVAVDVDAQGHVAHTEPDADTPAPIAVVLDQALNQWRFAPVMQDGSPAVVHSYLVAGVQALPLGPRKYSVRVSYVGAGPSYVKPTGGKGPDYPPQVLQALVESGRSHSGAAVVIDLMLPAGGELTATDAHVTTDADLNMREKLNLIAAVKRYVLLGSVHPEVVGGRIVTANLQTSIVVALFPVEFGGSQTPPATSGLRPEQAAKEQAANSAAAYQDASQSQSVLKPSMIDTVTLQP